MKKIGILTIHNSYNYGAVLQAYATQRTLVELGFDVELINYSTEVSKKTKKFLVLPKSKQDIKHNLRNIRHPLMFFKRKKKFETFIFKYMTLSKREYNRNNIRLAENEDYDYLVTGSDQTFNLNLRGNIWDRQAYFLPFEFAGKKISYAASMGEYMSLLTAEQKDWIKIALSDYSRISVREPVAADFIEDLIGKRPDVIFDPTLALTREQWDSVCKVQPPKGKIKDKEKYILFYTVTSEKWVVDFAEKISKQTGMKIVAAHPQNSLEIGRDFERVSDSGPSEFLSLIKNASFVITTSFHGTIFSMIYEKPFYSLVLGEGNRQTSLLSQAGLGGRVILEKSKVPEFSLDNSDVKQAKHFLEKANNVNINFLKSELN
jgi:hypothetical protein